MAASNISIQELFDRRQSARSAALSLLTGTEWPPESNDAAQDLLQSITNLPSIPADVPVDPVKDTVLELTRVLEAVHADIKTASEKYGRRGRGFRDRLEYGLSSSRRGRCTNTLRTCRDDIEKASANFRNCLRNTSTDGDPNSLQNVWPGLAEDRDIRSQTRSGALAATRKTFKTVETVSGAIPGVGGFVAVAAKVGLAFVNMIETMDKNEDMSKELTSHTAKLASYLEHFKKNLGAEKGDEVTMHVEDLHRELGRIQKKVKEWNSSGHFKRAFSSRDHAEELKAHQDTVQTALEEMQLLVSLKTADLVIELKNTDLRAERTRLLDRLGDGSYGARGSAIEDVICLPGTRVELLSRIDKWIRDTSPSAERVLWIRGMAGRGKSTIASTVAHNWASKGSCAVFHFRRGQNALDGQLICSLARQLGKGLVSKVKDAILDCVRENEDIARERLEQQFKTLFVGSLQRVQGHPHPIVIIVDALDECKDVNDAVRFVRLIDQHSSSLPANVKFLLTCRPEPPLVLALELRKWRAEDLDSISHVAEDVKRFIQHACTQIREEHGLPMSWPSGTNLEAIVEMSQGLFQWARTAIAYIATKSPEHRLQELLQKPSNWGGLDDLYHQILSRAFNEVGEDSEREQMLLSVLGTLVVAPYPVTLEVIAFLHADYDIVRGQENIVEFLRRDILADLNSLLHIPASPSEPLRLMHTSIRDLLTAQKRCKSQRYFVDSITDHRRLAYVSLKIMERDLKQNICRLRGAGTANSEIKAAVDIYVAKGLGYCCRSWSTHLTAGVGSSEATLDAGSTILVKFNRFCDGKILSWLEVMSLIGATTEAYTIAKQVHHWLLQWPRGRSDDSLRKLWDDTQRFIAAFFKPISFNALDIYASALPLCPAETKLWLKYSFQATAWILVGDRERSWSATIWRAEAGPGVGTVAFSPDGTYLVSGSDDGAIRLWDARTGARLGDPLTGHSSFITAVVFSPDGRTLASGSYDKTIRLWDMKTGAVLGDPLTGRSGRIKSVVFSPDGKVLASGSEDETIYLWNVQAGAALADPLTGHRGSVNSVVFSPDGKVLASGSTDETIRLWNAQTGAALGNPLTGHSSSINSVVFSPDGKVLASGSRDETIRLWNAQTGAALGDPLTGHSGSVNSVVFSPDGKVIISGSTDKTVRLWNAQTGAPLGDPLTGHSRSIMSAVFHPDGKALASGSQDGTIRLWDAQTGVVLADPLTGHGGSIRSAVFSPDGKLLASGSDDKTVRLWDAQTGSPLGDPLTGHSRSIRSVVFSPDSKVLASGSDDKTVQLWDLQTGAPLADPLTGHGSSISSVVFSPDGKALASGSYDETIRLWDAQTGAASGDPLTGHSSWITSVVFSPDGETLASGSFDGTIRLWDAQTGAASGDPLTGHSSWITSVVFSPDGKVLASGSDDKTIRLWNAQTGALLDDPLTGHSKSIKSVAFSPSGKILASASNDMTIRLWDADTGATLGDFLTGHSAPITSVLFTPNGDALVSVSCNGAVRFWDPLTSQMRHVF